MEEESNPRIVIIALNVSKDLKGTINVHEKDDPQILVDNFLKLYSLDPTIKPCLVKVVKSHQEKHKKQQISLRRRNSAGFSSLRQSLHCSMDEKLSRHSYRYTGNLNKSSSCSSINFGHVLYDKGVKMKEYQRQKSQERLQEREIEQSKHLTFKPKISQTSKKLSLTINKDIKSQKNRERFQNLLSQREKEVSKDCYFVPVISNRSSVHAKDRNIFTDLYRDARRRSQVVKTSSQEFLPKPSTIKMSERTEELIERLSSSKKVTDANTERIRKAHQANYDKETGQKFFTPLTGRAPSGSRGERSVWEELYMKTPSREICEQPERPSENKLTSHDKNTSHMFENFKQHKFEAIFTKLDSDRDGKISCEKICIESMGVEVLNILSPLFEEMDSFKAVFNLHDFCQRMHVLYERITPQDKMALIKNDKNIKDDFTFEPKINKKSKIINRNNTHLGNNVYERNKCAMEIRDLKLQKARELKSLLSLTNFLP